MTPYPGGSEWSEAIKLKYDPNGNEHGSENIYDPHCVQTAVFYCYVFPVFVITYDYDLQHCWEALMLHMGACIPSEMNKYTVDIKM